MHTRVRGGPTDHRHTETSVSTVPETEPWTALLEAGRSDERLVHDDVYESRAPRLVYRMKSKLWKVPKPGEV